MVASEICWRLEGRGVGVLLHGVDQLLDADAEPDIELAGLFQDGLTVIDRVELLLAHLEHAGLAFAEHEKLRGGVAHGDDRRIVRQIVEVGLDAFAALLELRLDRIERLAGIGRQRCGHVGGHQIAGRAHVADLADGAGRFGRVIRRHFGRAEDGVEPGLRIEHRGTGGGDEGVLCLAQRVVLLVAQRADLEPLARRRDQALGRLVGVLDVLLQRADDGFVGAELDDLAELGIGLLRDLLHLPGALVERIVALHREQAGPLGGERGTLRGQLQACGEPRNVAA